MEAVECGTCLAGTYSGAGAGSCSMCTSGKHSDERVETLRESCLDCLAGTRSGSGAGSCTNCEVSKIEDTSALIIAHASLTHDNMIPSQ